MKHLTQKSLLELLRTKPNMTVGDLKSGDFGYVPAAALGVAYVPSEDKSHVTGPYVYVDRNAPVYQATNWQNKPGLISIRRVLDGVVLAGDTAGFYAMKIQMEKSHHQPFQKLSANPHLNFWIPVLQED